MRHATTNFSIENFIDRAKQLEASYARLTDAAKESASQLSKIGLFDASTAFRELKDTIKAGNIEAIQNKSEALLKACKSEIYRRDRLDLTSGIATQQECMNTSHSIAWLLSYAVYAFYEYPFLSRLDLIIDLVDQTRANPDDLFEEMPNLENEIGGITAILDALHLHREVVFSRIVAYMQTADDYLIYLARTSLKELDQNIEVLKRAHEKSKQAYDDQNQMMGGWMKSFLKTDDFTVNLTPIADSVAVKLRKMEETLARAKAKNSTNRIWESVKIRSSEDCAKAFHLDCNSIQQEINAQLGNAKQAVKNYAQVGVDDHQARIQALHDSYISLEQYAKQFKDRGNITFYNIEKTIREHENFIRDIMAHEAPVNAWTHFARYITDNNEIDVKSKIGGLDKESKDSFVQEVSDNVKSRLSLKKISRRFWYSAGLFIMSTLLVIAAIVIRMNYYHLQIGYLLPVSLGLAGFSLLFSGLLLYFKRQDSQLCLKNFDKINAMVPAEQYATSAEISLSNSAHGEEIQNNHSPESISVRPEVSEEVNRGRYGGDV